MKYPSLALREEIEKRKKKLANFRKHHKKVFDRLNELEMEKCGACADLLANCKHEVHITVCSYYAGSYSNDYDDWHPGERLCIICGYKEDSDTSGKWYKLTNPYRRFEMPYLYGTVPDYVIKTRFGHKNFPYTNPQNHPFEEVMAFVEKYGYTYV